MDITRLKSSEARIKIPISKAGFPFQGFRPGLRTKIIFLVSVISLISILVATSFLYDFQRRQIIQASETATANLSNTIKANLRHAMLFVDWDMEKSILDSAALAGTVRSVRILNAKGKVGASSSASEVGLVYSQSQPVCQLCHANASPPVLRTVIYQSATDGKILLNVNTFENDADCQKCHDPQEKVLGVLMLETPLDGMNQQLNAAFWKTILIAGATFFAMVGMLALLLRRFVTGPVEKLETGVAEIIHGNLEGQVEVPNEDELGRLAHSFNTMRKQLHASHDEMEKRNQELIVLNEVALVVGQSLDLQDVLEKALEMVTEKLGMEACFIRLRDPATGFLSLRAYRGVSEAFVEKVEERRQDPERDISRSIVETGKTVFMPRVIDVPALEGLWEDDRSYVLIPLKSKGSVVGTLGIVGFAGRPMNERTVAIMEAMANEVSIAIDNALLLAESKHNEQEALTLQQLGTQISASLSLKEVLLAVAEAARELLEVDIGLVGLLDDGEQEVALKAASGLSKDAVLAIHLPLSQGAARKKLFSGQSLTGEMNGPDQPVVFQKALVENENIRSFLAVPLERGGKVTGLIEVMTRKQRRFSAGDAQLLVRLAHHVVVAIENAKLYRQLKYLAVLEERDRLGREIHDHLSQTLGYINIKTSMVQDLLGEGQAAQVREGLVELKQAARMAYTDVREAIFNLRTPILPNVGLLGSLEEYLSEYRTHYGLDARLVVEDEDLADISPEVANQLLRIIQEALVNVRKHADATKVRISYHQAVHQVCFTIEDNGRGFKLEQIPGTDQQHYGLQIMRERAESVGGSMSLSSQIGQGTRVVVCVPNLFQSEEGR